MATFYLSGAADAGNVSESGTPPAVTRTVSSESLPGHRSAPFTPETIGRAHRRALVSDLTILPSSGEFSRDSKGGALQLRPLRARPTLNGLKQASGPIPSGPHVGYAAMVRQISAEIVGNSLDAAAPLKNVFLPRDPGASSGWAAVAGHAPMNRGGPATAGAPSEAMAGVARAMPAAGAGAVLVVVEAAAPSDAPAPHRPPPRCDYGDEAHWHDPGGLEPASAPDWPNGGAQSSSPPRIEASSYSKPPPLPEGTLTKPPRDRSSGALGPDDANGGVASFFEPPPPRRISLDSSRRGGAALAPPAAAKPHAFSSPLEEIAAGVIG